MNIRCITDDIDGETRAMIDVYIHFIAVTEWDISFEEFIDLHDGWMTFTTKPEDYPYMYTHADLIMNRKVLSILKKSDDSIYMQIIRDEIKELKNESETLSLAYDILYERAKDACGDDMIKLDLELSKIESFIRNLAMRIGGKENYHELLKRIGVKTILD